MSVTINHTRITDYMMSKASYKSIPISGTFEITPMCNFDCKMCYIHKSKQEVLNHPRQMMTLEDWKDIADASIKQGMLFLLITGGEPLSSPFFCELYEYMVKQGVLVTVNTNGSLVTDRVFEMFNRYPPKRINITLYGASDETYESICGVRGMYSKVISTIEKLQDAHIQVKLNCSLTPYNVNDLKKMVDYAKSKKLILDVATYMFPPVRRKEDLIGINESRFTPEESAKYRLETYCLQMGEEKYKQYLNQIMNGYTPPLGLDEYCEDPIDGHIRCRAGKASFWITWDGYITPCGMMNDPKVDLYKKGFDESWSSLTSISRNLHLSGICAKCENNDICHSCAAMAISETGNVQGIPKYLCKMVDEMKNIAQKELLNLKG